jgi:LmbE family N-acetylglucosaminyl deacetylase
MYFISPHFDDPCFSMGGLIGKLGNFDKTIINVFVIGKYIRRMAMAGGSEVFRERIISEIRYEEDRRFCKKYGIKQVNLGLAEFSSEDRSHDKFIKDLSKKIGSCIDFSRRCQVFFPMGIGEHVNHLQVFDACKLLMEANRDREFILYEDLPYGHRILDRFRRTDKLSDFLRDYGLKNYINILSKGDVLRKREDIMIYESQHRYKRPDTVKIHRYFTRVSLLRHPYEGFWIRNDDNEISRFLVENPHNLASFFRRFF